MVVVLLVVGALGMPLAGLLVRPDVRGARHGAEMFIDLGRFGWYGYLVLSAVGLVVGLTGVLLGTPHGRRLATGAATALLTPTLVFGTIHVLVTTTGMFRGDGRPLSAAAAAVATVTAAIALTFAQRVVVAVIDQWVGGCQREFECDAGGQSPRVSPCPLSAHRDASVPTAS
ncbi:hypothetical protein FHS29_004823 [Saccharothrix tamanrassetensis]|uniref:Uncharacterized protein n=1 Tax=Saccharothrix tamanrassetensis TaxID=1051531 RepID=A0A841CQE2_9PSEU|nr:hypothetical protein [Saccharothrix tamanrassetensis]MBB5958215.1 hypothetical protein [Saccharothrix tamanrassetensis]